MRDYYGKRLRFGDYVRYGHPNSKHARPAGKIKWRLKDGKIGIEFKEVIGIGFSVSNVHHTESHNVVKLTEEQAILLKIKREL